MKLGRAPSGCRLISGREPSQAALREGGRRRLKPTNDSPAAFRAERANHASRFALAACVPEPAAQSRSFPFPFPFPFAVAVAFPFAFHFHFHGPRRRRWRQLLGQLCAIETRQTRHTGSRSHRRRPDPGRRFPKEIHLWRAAGGGGGAETGCKSALALPVPSVCSRRVHPCRFGRRPGHGAPRRRAERRPLVRRLTAAAR